jgi:hypothetical protein
MVDSAPADLAAGKRESGLIAVALARHVDLGIDDEQRRPLAGAAAPRPPAAFENRAILGPDMPVPCVHVLRHPSRRRSQRARTVASSGRRTTITFIADDGNVTEGTPVVCA